ncbi:MAG: thioredoxin [Porticoccaceae bacterium]|nr:thioredoxin [Porticoccaceae bacterium]
MNVNVVDISYENAQQYLIDESMVRPVLVDFWADWCAPCKVLMPLLDRLAGEYQGDFLLAKVNADNLADIAAQFGVRSLPTVVLMKEGQPIDAFQGALPEQDIRKFLDKHLPKPWEKKLAAAQARIEAGELETAQALIREAYAESCQHPKVGLVLAKLCLQLHQMAEARTILAVIPLKDQDSLYKQLLAQLELMEESAKTPEIRELEERLNQEPDNLEIAYELGVQFSQNNYHREALELLYTVLREDRNFRDGGARKIYLDILATLGKGNPLAIEFQRKIYTLLY